MSPKAHLARLIASEGPLSIPRFMDLCLHHPDFGYYATRPAIGAKGDFITAPHVSQMVGELLGLWVCEIYRQLDRPPTVRLVELGPGDGVMIQDVLRAIGAADPALAAACDLVLLDTSPPLRAAQEKRLAAAGKSARWIAALSEVRGLSPVILLANEFLDCLPIDQAILTPAGWRRRAVGMDVDGALAFVACGPAPAALTRQAAGQQIGSVIEWSQATETLGGAVSALVAQVGGAALFLDYGCGEPDLSGDTLQAVRRHRKESPLAHPGEADLTAQVRFAPFLANTREAGAIAPQAVRQADFLAALGIESRAAALARARPDRADLIGRQVRRLVDPDEMGELFKVACMHSPGLSPPGFPA